VGKSEKSTAMDDVAREEMLRKVRLGMIDLQDRIKAQRAAEWGLGDPSIEADRSSQRARFDRRYGPDGVVIGPLPGGREAQSDIDDIRKELSVPPMVTAKKWVQEDRVALGLPDDTPDRKVLRIAKKKTRAEERANRIESKKE